MEQARGIVNIEAWRSSTRELRPYGSTSSIDPNQGQGQGEGEGSGLNRRFSAGAGEGAMAGEIFGGRERGMKRAQEVEEEEEEGTEVDEDEFQPQSQDHGQGQGTNDFPPVFASPNLSQPELFHQNAHAQMKQTRFAVPTLPLPRDRDDRMKRALPARRVLGKSVSAPVGRLGGGMDVDMQDGVEDGFDISEWAGKEDF